MRAYRAVWGTWTTLVVIVGVGLCLGSSSVFVTALLFVTLAVCAGVVAGNLRLLAERPEPELWTLVVSVAKVACRIGAAGVGLYGFVLVIGADTLAIVAVLGCSAPAVVLQAARWLRSSDAAEVGSETSTELRQWSDAELYAVWCSSWASVADAQKPDRAAVAADARQELLAEFERRHPRELEGWLTSGIAGEPPRFLLAKRTDR